MYIIWIPPKSTFSGKSGEDHNEIHIILLQTLCIFEMPKGKIMYNSIIHKCMHSYLLICIIVKISTTKHAISVMHGLYRLMVLQFNYKIIIACILYSQGIQCYHQVTDVKTVSGSCKQSNLSTYKVPLCKLSSTNMNELCVDTLFIGFTETYLLMYSGIMRNTALTCVIIVSFFKQKCTTNVS